MRDSEFEFIRQLVYARSRINLSQDKRQLVSARLGKRLRATKIPTVTAYCELLQSGAAGEELEHLIDAISTNHTFFFREAAHFDFLRDTVVPEMLGRAREERWSQFRIWSAACSSGEEPYTLAITLAECMPDFPWQIEATDISHRVLAKAEAAIYTGETVSRMPSQVIRTYFQRGFGPQEGYYRVKSSLRDRVSFHHLNLLEGEPPFREPFQVIFCRNVMIYFDRDTQNELVSRLSKRLVPGGYLFVGHSESLTQMRHTLQPIKPAVYRKPL
ncbi:protein-glutamate O-methyltransferase CheR [Opitutus sp. ER46]|uniref:CheR family methyltransferase n=1 Tax=Opitutus sp. ER46 TaxID=2161864 RepID=UPI000D2FF91E|nr:protein-glutamate O-methyltransferase CheR [Opitutus sp. ER46]PTX90892.1 chemotaxis protein CheR [Opitutus sp. ER46]